MEKKITRDEVQKEVVKNSSKDLLILEHCTGLGKTLSSIKVQEKMKPLSTFIAVAEISHIENWKEEYKKHNKEFLLENTTIECYASLKKYRNLEVDLLILDEAHRISDLRREILGTFKVKKVIALSATLEYQQKEDLIQNTFKDLDTKNLYHSYIPLKTAIESGIIPQPNIYLIPLSLDNTKRTEEVIEVWGKKQDRQKITCNFRDMWEFKGKRNKFPAVELTIKCTEYEKNKYYDDAIEYYKNRYMQTRFQGIYYKWMNLGSQRKRFLGELKTSYIKKLLNKFDDTTRIVCFLTTIDQVNKVGGKNAIHSKRKDNSIILEKFQNKETNRLFSVGMLTEGQNLNDIDVGIIAQLDSKERPFIQKHGRVLRSKEPIQYVFYFKETRDTEYLSNILEGIDETYTHNINNLDEYIPK